MDSLWQTISVLVGGGALGGAVTAIGVFLNGRTKAKSDAQSAEKKAQADVDLAQEAQEFNQQVQIIEDLRRRIEHLEQAISDCIQDRSELRYMVGRLEGRLDQQGSDMQNLRATTTEASRDAVKLAGEVAAKGVEVAAQLVVASNTALSDSAIRLHEATVSARNSQPTERDIPTVTDSIH